MTDITLNDFKPVNNWEVDKTGEKWSDGEPKYLIDDSTKRRYWNESENCVRTKCILLSLGTPFVHTIASVINVAIRAIKILSLSHFLMPKAEEKTYSFKQRFIDLGIDAAKMFTAPLVPLALQAVSIYGWFRPYDARKLYATIERASYGSFILAPCFQPDPNAHLFGGNANRRDQY